jgi:hypothetical protein
MNLERHWLRIDLSRNVTGEHQSLGLRYLSEAERFSLVEWVTLLEAFTRLSDSMVWLNGESFSFQVFYDRFIDQTQSDGFITDLFAETDVAAGAPAIQASYARRIYHQLRSEPLALGDTPDTECLLSYCLYWWASFARGCAFEVEIFRDLEAAGIHFVAHDLRVREQRFSPSDGRVRHDRRHQEHDLFPVRRPLVPADL